MNGRVLEHIIKKHIITRNWFQGFSSPDLPLPPIKHYPALFILNTDTTDGPGEHWCVVIVFNKNHAEFFDSYGNPPSSYNLNIPIKQKSTTVQYNKKRVQGNKPNCGHHCIFYSIHRAEGKSLSFITNNLYTNNLTTNDRIAYNFIKNSYGIIYAEYSR